MPNSVGLHSMLVQSEATASLFSMGFRTECAAPAVQNIRNALNAKTDGLSKEKAAMVAFWGASTFLAAKVR
jgi:hypothetical protein